MALALKHAGAALVAVAFTALALAEGGYSLQVIASLTVVVWWVVIAGLLVRAWPGADIPAPALLCGGSLAALAGLSALSLLWAGDAGRAFEATLRVVGYLGLFAFIVLASRAGSARSWLVGLAWGIGIVAGLALISRFDPGTFGGADVALVFELPGAGGRLSFPIGYWNGLAAVVAAGIVLTCWLGAHAHSRLMRASAVAALPAFGLVIALAQSRGGALATAIGVLVLAALAGRQLVILGGAALGALGAIALALLADARPDLMSGLPTPAAHDQGLEMAAFTAVAVVGAAVARYALDPVLARPPLASTRLRPRRALGVLAAVAVVAIAATALTGALAGFGDPGGYVAEERDEGRLTSLQGSGRSQFWSVALDAYASAPVGGIGAGNYELFWNANNPIPAVIERAHSLYLQTLAELGIPGLALLLAFFGTAAWAGWRRQGALASGEVAAATALLAAGAVSAGLEWTWEIPATFAPLVLAAALLTGRATLPPSGEANAAAASPPSAPAAAPRARFGLGVAVIVVGFLSIWVAGVSLLTQLRIEDSQAAAARGELAEAAEAADGAATIQPWSAEPYLQLAQVEELRGRPEQAREALGEALERAPGDWRLWLVDARIALLEGDRAASAAAMGRAQALSPVPLEAPLPDGGSGVSGQ